MNNKLKKKCNWSLQLWRQIQLNCSCEFGWIKRLFHKPRKVSERKTIKIKTSKKKQAKRKFKSSARTRRLKKQKRKINTQQKRVQTNKTINIAKLKKKETRKIKSASCSYGCCRRKRVRDRCPIVVKQQKISSWRKRSGSQRAESADEEWWTEPEAVAAAAEVGAGRQLQEGEPFGPAGNVS